MLDDIREWISDNLRYILLGVAGLLVLVIIIFAVRVFTGRKDESKETKQKESTAVQEPETQADSLAGGSEGGATVSSAGDALVRDQKDVLDLVTRYYTAKLNQDYDTLSEICEVMDDKAKAEYESLDSVIEAYNNLMTYSKAGLTEGSYVVFAYFDAKMTGFDTLVPTLRGLYLVTNEEGNLIISDPDNHPDQKAYQTQVWSDDDVQALRKDAAGRYEDSLAQDPELAEFVNSIQEDQNDGTNSGGTDGEESGGEDSGDGSSEGSLGTMYATTGVNVRAEPSADSTLYGSLLTGMQVEVLENLDNGWSKIRYYTSNGTTMEGYSMTQYFSSSK